MRSRMKMKIIGSVKAPAASEILKKAKTMA